MGHGIACALAVPVFHVHGLTGAVHSVLHTLIADSASLHATPEPASAGPVTLYDLT